MRPDDVADKLFGYFFTQDPNSEGYITINDFLRSEGVIEPEDIQLVYQRLGEWFVLDPPVDHIRMKDTRKYVRGTMERYNAPRMSLDNTGFQIQLTRAGQKEHDKRIRDQHEAELIAKQNSSFDDVMRIAMENAEAAKLSAQAATDAVEESRRSGVLQRHSLFVAIVAAVAAVVAAIAAGFQVP